MSNILPHVLSLRCAAIPCVRIGFIGIGKRGEKALARYASIRGSKICALSDISASPIEKAKEELEHQGIYGIRLYSGKDGWKELCSERDLDLIYICTDWSSHVEVACYAMEQGKHTAVEVPAATTIEGCWKLVDTSERTRRHLIMLENCCYDPFALTTLKLAKAGTLGCITHCEGAYIHYLQDTFHENVSNNWMEQQCAEHEGNAYPTHGLGPIAQVLGIHRGDRMVSLTSLTASNGSDSYPLGRVNNTLIRTIKGKTILLQFDLSTPRPYSRLQSTLGTKGFTQKYPIPCAMFATDREELAGEKLTAFLKNNEHPITTKWRDEAERTKQPNAMNYTMDCRLIHCLNNGLPLDMDVYDAAEWSCIAELSAISAKRGGAVIEIPDFTRNRWELLKELKFEE